MDPHVLPRQPVGSLGGRFCRVRRFLSWSISAHEAAPGCCVRPVTFLPGQGLLKPNCAFFSPPPEVTQPTVKSSEALVPGRTLVCEEAHSNKEGYRLKIP